MGKPRGWEGGLTQTNRLSDVIVLCDVLYVCGWAGLRGCVGWGLVGVFVEVTHEANFSNSVWVGVVSGGLLKATLSLCILHTLFLCCTYCFVSFFFQSYFLFYEECQHLLNIECTFLNRVGIFHFRGKFSISEVKTGLIGLAH